MKNAFYFMLKAVFVLEIFFLSKRFGYAEKLNKKAMINVKIDDVTNWTTNNYHIQISKSKSNLAMKFGQLIEYSMRNNYLPRKCRKLGMETSSRRFLAFLKSFILR